MGADLAGMGARLDEKSVPGEAAAAGVHRRRSGDVSRTASRHAGVQSRIWLEAWDVGQTPAAGCGGR